MLWAISVRLHSKKMYLPTVENYVTISLTDEQRVIKDYISSYVYSGFYRCIDSQYLAFFKPASVTIIFNGQNACGAKWTFAWECGISWFVVVYIKLLKMWLLFSVNFSHHGKKP